jgi:hypothetical protein
VRGGALLRGERIDRQRPDLPVPLEGYTHLRAQGALLLTYERWRRTRLVFGLGGEHREVMDLVGADGEAIASPPGSRNELDPLAFTSAEIVFDPDQIRRDRKHELTFFARHLRLEDGFGAAGYRYQNVLELGWNDLWLWSKSHVMWGNVPFVEEEPVGGPFLRGVFPDRFFVERVVNAGLEFRWSLSRDLLKLSIFDETAAFGVIDRTTGEQTLQFGTSFGAGIHALIANGFQLDIYYAVGFTPHQPMANGVSLNVRQAF